MREQRLFDSSGGGEDGGDAAEDSGSSLREFSACAVGAKCPTACAACAEV
jgi:hypothetical protein